MRACFADNEETPMTFRPLARAAALAFVLAALAAPSAGLAQAWPAKPLRLVIPFPPGGSTDTTGRLLAQSLGEALGQPVVVENKPGGNLVIGVDAVAKAPADGHTLLLTLDIALTMNPHLLAKLPYAPEKDLAPVSLVTTQQMWFVAGPKLGARTPQELVALAKAQPRRINYGSGAIVGQLTGELFRMLTGAEMTYVPFKGSGPALQALLAGDIDLAVADITPFAPYIAQGKLRALGQTGTRRFESQPDVPTMIEQGIRDFQVTGWFGLFVPGGTPAPVIARLNAEVATLLARPEIRQKILSFGLMPTSSTPQALAERAREDAEKWGKVIRAAGIRLD
jgi:tripartite-type tricarboxylate transporter receptor subunit TctC